MGTQIEELFIPRNVQRIEEKAFHQCQYLKSVIFEEDSQLVTFDDFSFSECVSLTSFQIPQNVRNFNRKSFQGKYG